MSSIENALEADREPAERAGWPKKVSRPAASFS